MIVHDSSMNAPIQLAGAASLEQRQSIQTLLLDRLRTNLSELDRALGRQRTCTRLQLEGGWYVVLRVPVTDRMKILPLRSCASCLYWCIRGILMISPMMDIDLLAGLLDLGISARESRLY